MRHGVPSFVQREHVRIEQRARAVVIGDDVVDAEIGFDRAQRPASGSTRYEFWDAGRGVAGVTGGAATDETEAWRVAL